MYAPIAPKIELNAAQLEALARRFESIATVPALAQLLGVTEQALLAAAARQEYLGFYIPKPGGAKRFIEHPASKLKAIQHSLNRYLQAVYYGIKPDCSYGFILRPTDDFQPRNIYFNAMRHHKSEWFWQIDLKDFFHTITKTHLKNLFQYLFFFPPELTAVLTALCTSQGRLPMGAPTSPVLSNLVCLYLDKELQQIADDHAAIYTRYADDLTFSFSAPPPDDFLEPVKIALLRHQLVINENKVGLRARAEQPEITGLTLGRDEKPTLSKHWLKRLKQEIRVYQWLMSEAVRER
ncbi:MAG: reverse transcriptase family protein, partial [Saprospiraceae bacterium]|nr:reverse transcriptase family protein [Saprospiraceae bacterium]